MSRQMLFAYIPVLHRGYQEFFKKYQGATLYLFSRAELMQLPELEYLKKDIRVLDVELAARAIKSWQILEEVLSVSISDLADINYSDAQVITTNDDVGRALAKQLPSVAPAPTFEAIFLRWDKNLMEQQQTPPAGVRVSSNQLDREIMQQAFTAAGQSSDWWRHVGAALWREGEPLFIAHNQHMPMEDQQYKNSDPRISFSSGVGIEASSSIHAEAGLIAQAARRGIALEGASLYVTTFPCPVCAKQVAAAGIKQLYYAKGYAVLDGLEILQSAGVEIKMVKFDQKQLLELEKLENQGSVVEECYRLDS